MKILAIQLFTFLTPIFLFYVLQQNVMMFLQYKSKEEYVVCFGNFYAGADKIMML